MSLQDKPIRISKIMRSKAEEFLSNRRFSHNLVDILKHFDSGMDTVACLLALELVFTNLLKNGEMHIEIIPLKSIEPSVENQYRQWLRNVYEETWNKMLASYENPLARVQIQALTSCMNILAYEGRYPLEYKENMECFIPLDRLKSILMKLLSGRQHNTHLISKFAEYFVYDDVLFHSWKVLPNLTAKCNPNEVYIMNYLLLLETLQVECNHNGDIKILCSPSKGLGTNVDFNFDEAATKRCLNKIWDCIIFWEHTPATHKKLLIVLLEKVLAHLDKPLLLTDFLMESLDVGGPVSLLALQGIFILMQKYNLDYPNIFIKLYSMFEPEIFHTKYKPRLFYLADIFLSSTHLPENLVAAFAKRLARLALVTPSRDIITICMFISNLIFRHPSVKHLLNYSIGGTTTNDPYIMDECDPLKSNAINSSLWELQTLHNHAIPSVAGVACFMRQPLPQKEFDIGRFVDATYDDIFDKELKNNCKLVALAFDKPNWFALNKGEKIMDYWDSC